MAETYHSASYSLERKLVVIIQRSAERDGSAMSGLTVVDAIHGLHGCAHVIFGADGPVIADYQSAGCQTSIVPHGQWLLKASLFRSLRRLTRDWNSSLSIASVLRTLAPDLVYVNSLFGWAGALAARKIRVPVVWHLRELFTDVGGEAHPPAIGGKWLVRREIRRLSSHVVVVSRDVACQVLATDPEAVSVISNAVGKDFDKKPLRGREVRGQFGFGEHQFVVGAIGSIRPVKGFDVLVRAIATLRESIPHLIVAIAGNGDGSRLTELAEEFGVTENLRLLGCVHPIRPFYGSCDVICVPSRSESFGRVALEAMASGVPVVATAVGGMKDTIVDGETGLLVEPESPTGVAHAIVRIYRDEPFRAALVEAARADFASRFHTESIIRGLQELILQSAAK